MAVDRAFSKGNSETLEFVCTTFIEIFTTITFLAGLKRAQFDTIMEKSEHELLGWQATSYPFHRKQILTMPRFKSCLYNKMKDYRHLYF